MQIRREDKNSKMAKSKISSKLVDNAIIEPSTDNTMRSHAKGDTYTYTLSYNINIQFLIAVFYMGTSGDCLGFIAGSLDLPNAEAMRDYYYQYSPR